MHCRVDKFLCLALWTLTSVMFYPEQAHQTRTARLFIAADFAPIIDAAYEISDQTVGFDESFSSRNQEVPCALGFNLEGGILLYELIQLSVCYSAIEQGGASLSRLTDNSISLKLLNGKLTLFPFRKFLYLFIGGGFATLRVSHQELFMYSGYLDEESEGSGYIFGGGIAIPVKDVATINVGLESSNQTYGSDSILDKSEYMILKIGIARYF